MPSNEDIEIARLHYEFAKERHQDKLKHIQQYVEEVHQGKVNPEVFTPAFLEEAADAYIEGKNGNYYDYDDDYFGTEQSDYYEQYLDYSPAPFNPKDSEYKYAFSPEGLSARWTQSYREEFNEGIARKIADSDYEQFHGVVFDPETGEPIARYDPKTSSYIPFEYREGEVYGLDRYTGEVQSFVNMFSYEILDKIDAGIYTVEGDYVLDEHGQPIAELELVRKVTDSTQRYDREGIAIIPYEPPVFKDIADYNLDDYLSGFSPNMESTLRELYEQTLADEDDFLEVQENLQNVHYAYEQVMNYSNYEELLTGYYEMAKALKGGEELTPEEMKQLEQAVNDDRVKRTRRKKKRTKKK